MPDSKSYDLDHTATEKTTKTNITMVTFRTYIFVFFPHLVEIFSEGVI